MLRNRVNIYIYMISFPETLFSFSMCFLALFNQNFVSEDFFHVTGNPSLFSSFGVQKKVVGNLKNMYTTFVT